MVPRAFFGLRKKNVTLLACDIYAFQANNRGLQLSNVSLVDSLLFSLHSLHANNFDIFGASKTVLSYYIAILQQYNFARGSY